jgi:hypothetical protein
MQETGIPHWLMVVIGLLVAVPVGLIIRAWIEGHHR